MPASELRIPGVIPYITGRLVSELGRSMLSIALGWQLYERTHSAFALGLVGLVQVVPVVGLVVLAGDVADRRSRKAIGVITQVAHAAVAAGIAAVSYTNAPVAIIYALLFVSGVANAFASPAIAAILPNLVPKEHLVKVNAWSSISWQLAATAGPAVAGLFLAAVGKATSLYVADAVSAALFAVLILRLPAIPPPAHPERARSSRDLLAGLRFVFRCKELLGAITLDLFAVLLGGVSALLPIFAKDILHCGPRGLGLLQAAPSLGALQFAWQQTRMAPFEKPGRVLLWCVAGFGAATLGFAFSRSLWLSFFLLYASGAFDAFSVVVRRTLEQVVTPDRLRGRVGAVHYVFLGMSNELGEFESGSTAALLGAVGSVILGGAGTLVVVVLAAWIWPELRRMKRLDRISPYEALAIEVLGEPRPAELANQPSTTLT